MVGRAPRPTPRARGTRPGLAGAVLAAFLAAYFWLALGYADATPPWNNPDEPAHYNYVAQLARTGTLPVLQPGDWDAAMLERLKSTYFTTNEPIDRVRYEGWQPPLYYLLAAQVYRLAPDDSQLGRIQWLRTLGVVLGGATLVVGYLVAREALSSRWLAVAAAGVMAGVPMFTAMSAAIGNDTLANLLAAVVALASLRVARQPVGRGQAVGLGVLLGLALLTKLTLVVLVGIALVATLAPARTGLARTPELLRRASLAGGTAFVVVLPWLVRQGLTYGWGDVLAAQRHDEVVVGQPRFPGLSIEYARDWAATTFHSTWAQFGWMGIPAPERLYWLWGVATLAACAGLALLLARSMRGQDDVFASPPRLAVLVAIAAAVFAALVAYNLRYEQAQGRYLFPALAPMAALMVAGWAALLPRPARAVGPVAGAAALVLLNVYTLQRVLVPAFGVVTGGR